METRMQGKHQVLLSGGTTNSYTNSEISRVLEYDTSLIGLKNFGGGSGIVYRVQGKMDHGESLFDWFTIKSGTDLLNSGGMSVSKLTDPWGSVRVQVKSKQTDRSCAVMIWINKSPR
jgi:hypothetical protein